MRLNDDYKKVLLLFILFLSIFSLWTSCTKEEGEYGNSSIQGRVFATEYNSAGVLKASYYMPYERVFIVYGDNPTYNDLVRTHHDGTFRFDFLSKGTYTVYAYSECIGCHEEIEPVSITVDITKNRETYILEDLVIRK